MTVCLISSVSMAVVVSFFIEFLCCSYFIALCLPLHLTVSLLSTFVLVLVLVHKLRQCPSSRPIEIFEQWHVLLFGMRHAPRAIPIGPRPK